MTSPSNIAVKRPKHAINGWINLDKPYEMTSTQAVGAVKRILSPKKIGHAGTLDPLATGVLPLALGEATKTVPYMMDATKEYRFTLAFGKQTDTDDREGTVIARSDVRPTDKSIQALLPHYTGVIEQRPPAFSAIKVQGKRAYDMARQGEEVVLEPRPVRIDTLTLLERPDAEMAIFSVTCGKGTYIRSLARDLAEALGSCGHVATLQRTRVGCFKAEAAISLDELESCAIKGAVSQTGDWLEPVERALDDIPAAHLDQEQAQRLRHGQQCLLSPCSFEEEKATLYKAFRGSKLIGLVKRQGRCVTPQRLFNL